MENQDESIGQRFNRLIVLESKKKDNNKIYLLCKCECGHIKEIYKRDVISGRTKSCGCLHREAVKAAQTRHGMFRHPAYKTWGQMKVRCLDPNNPSFKWYGDIGITICNKWMDFEGFWEDMGDTWQPGLSIDRIEVEKGYFKENCRWATRFEQSNNRRNNKLVTLPDGSSTTVSQAARLMGIDAKTIYARIERGWSGLDLFKQPRRSAK